MLKIETTIGFATDSDAEELGALSRRYVEHDLSWKYTPARIRALMKNASRNVIVAREGSTVAGFGIMTYRDDTANLDLLAVKVRFRGRGVGKQIVHWLEDVAETAGVVHMYVQVRKINAGATRFYERLGFHLVDEEAGYYQGRETAVIMCKSIRKLVGST